ncbi:MAG: hypothetical protein JXR71_03875, partial [Bacteroidales bacterium]|nr:hypothetical protein [Bacteroidales bacterium]
MIKKILFTVAGLLAGLSLWAQTATKPAGSGTSSDPYQIATLDNLYWVTQNSSSWGSDFIQTADIDATATKNWNGGAGFSPIGNYSISFTGTYNGNDHIISGLFINLPTGEAGFFDHTGSGSVIENLGLENVDIGGTTNVGGLLAVGSATIRNCYTTGKITEASTSGVNTTSIGGLAGQTGNGNVSNCYSTCSINSVSTGQYFAGGLTGGSGGTITNCYATGAINISTTGSTGGLIALKGASGVVTNSFWDIQTTGVSTSQGGTGKTTAEMKTESTYTGWNFTTNTATVGPSSPFPGNLNSVTISGTRGAAITNGNQITYKYLENTIGTITLSDPSGHSQNVIVSPGQSTVTVSGGPFQGLTLHYTDHNDNTIYQNTITIPVWRIQSGINNGYPYLPGQTVPAGTGTSSDPYQIATLGNLYWVSQHSSSWGSY